MREIVFHQGGLEHLASQADIEHALRRVAEEIAADIDAPSEMKTFVHSGQKGRGNVAFAQAGMRGDGALAVEFGTSRTEPLSPVRKAVAKRRH